MFRPRRREITWRYENEDERNEDGADGFDGGRAIVHQRGRLCATLSRSAPGVWGRGPYRGQGSTDHRRDHQQRLECRQVTEPSLVVFVAANRLIGRDPATASRP